MSAATTFPLFHPVARLFPPSSHLCSQVTFSFSSWQLGPAWFGPISSYEACLPFPQFPVSLINLQCVLGTKQLPTSNFRDFAYDVSSSEMPFPFLLFQNFFVQVWFNSHLFCRTWPISLSLLYFWHGLYSLWYCIMLFVCRFILDASFALVVVVILIFHLPPSPQDHFFLSQILVVVFFCPPGFNHWEAGFYMTTRASFPVPERV